MPPSWPVRFSRLRQLFWLFFLLTIAYMIWVRSYLSPLSSDELVQFEIAKTTQKAQAIIRGLRAVSDFEFEFQLALMNRKLNGQVETIFMMPRETYTFLSSRIVKEIARLGGNVEAFVPQHVRAALARKFRRATTKS